MKHGQKSWCMEKISEWNERWKKFKEKAYFALLSLSLFLVAQGAFWS